MNLNDLNLGWMAAITAAVVASWGHIMKLKNVLIMEARVTDAQMWNSLSTYLAYKAKPSRYFRLNYRVITTPSPDGGVASKCTVSTISQGMGLLWFRKKPLWISPQGNHMELSIQHYFAGRKVSFLRGTLDFDALCRDAQAFEDSLRPYSAFSVTDVMGTAGKTTISMSSGDSPAPSVTLSGEDGYVSNWAGICLDKYPQLRQVPLLSTYEDSPESAQVSLEIRRFLGLRDTYAKRGIPWRRGYALVGTPGTGKTSLVRTVAQTHQIPVFRFHISTLLSCEFTTRWAEHAKQTPCILLIEDIDAVFHGRENVSGVEGSVSFDVLLNALDGVRQFLGVLVFITTNQEEHLDPALLRPGRIDRVVVLPANMPAEARLAMASRILGAEEGPRVFEETLETEYTPAAFQELCTVKALSQLWEDGKAWDTTSVSS